MEHEDVVIRRGRRSAVTMMIAVHSRKLGPAAGGCRLRRYTDWRDGLDDALRLSEAMTYKCAAAGLPFGGGKSVIALDEHTPLTADLRRAVLDDLGELIDSLGGAYIAGPDVGTGPQDMVEIRRRTTHVCCLPEEHGGIGTSSVPTAAGVLAALRAGARKVFGTASVAGRTIVISGYGSVGALIAEGLAGARVVVSDIDPAKRALAERAGFGWVEPDSALRTAADILVPAALGGIFSPDTIAALDVPLIVGPANNQLTDDSMAELLAARQIVWIPDFVASAGGVVYTLGREIEGLTHEAAMANVTAIGSTVHTILDDSANPLAAAHLLATTRLDAAPGRAYA